MIEFPWNSRWNYESWFYFDESSFDQNNGSVQTRLRTYKCIGCDHLGRLVLHHQIYHDPDDWRNFTVRLYEIDRNEYAWFLDRAIKQGKVKAEDKDRYLDRVSSLFCNPWSNSFNMIVYLDERYALFQEKQKVHFALDGKCYRLSFHPYGPCTYIETGDDTYITIHNAFDPYQVIESFAKGSVISSISGVVYDPEDFCIMLHTALKINADSDISYVEGKIAVDKLKKLGAFDPESAVELSQLGVRRISDAFSYSRRLNERVMYTEDGRAYLKIREKAE